MTQQDSSSAFHPLAAVTDSDLVDAMAAGNTDAMEVLYDRYHRAVFAFALRLLGDRIRAEDLVQEAFLRAWRQANRFSDARGSFITWLLSITHNLAIDDMRKHARRPMKADHEDPLEMLATMRDDGPPVEDLALLGHLRSVVQESLQALPPEQRRTLELAYFRGMTQREIAESLDQPLGTVKTRMRLALVKMRTLLEAHGLDVT